MALKDFSDEQLREIYVRARRTLNRINDKSKSFRMQRDEPEDPEYHARLVKSKTNDQYFRKLVEVTFFIHAVASGVEKRLPRIEHYLGDYKRTVGFGERDVQQMLGDRDMFRSEKKIRACIHNAQKFDDVVNDEEYKQYGKHAFAHYIMGFDPFGSDEGIADLAKDMMRKFEMMGIAAVHHFMLNFDFPVVKPDVNMMRTFYRIGLTTKPKDPLGTQVAAGKLARAADVPVTWVDNLVGLGMKNKGREVCSTTLRCWSCDVRSVCRSATGREVNKYLPVSDE